ncbi:MAG: lysophospholipid acyltransferase family protein [Treponemataceae bacterium]
MLKTFITFFKIGLFVIKHSGLLRKIKKAAARGDNKFIDEILLEKEIEFSKLCVDLTGSEIEVIGLENIPTDRSVVYIANHQGMMDMPLLLGGIPFLKSFIAKKEASKIPVLSTWMKFMHCIFIDRKNIRQSLEAIHKGVEIIKSGYSMVIFPEGTRSRGGPVKPFKPGSFKLAFNSEAPIVPVSIDGTWHILEETGKIQGSKLRLVVHPIIETANTTKEQRIEIIKQTQSVIESALTSLSFKEPQNSDVQD